MLSECSFSLQKNGGIKMISFRGDYSEGAHEQILEVLINSNREQTPVYGADYYTELAKQLIKDKIGCENCEIRFLVGGTQTNQVAISHILRPHQAVIATKLGHINVHETGAIEATGHKIIEVETTDGKIRPQQIEVVMQEHTDFHMVQPKMVYISNSTELGTIYKREELLALREICDQYNLYLYLDGARLAVALTAVDNDVLLPDYPRYLDAFYIGGTKNGALFGEALVVVNPALQADLSYSVKRCGALLAKGRLLGLQFAEFFHADLYEKLGRHANQMAMKLKNGFKQKGYTFFVDSPTNQQFIVLNKSVQAELMSKYVFQNIKSLDEQNDVIRFVTSWATKSQDVDELINDLPQK